MAYVKALKLAEFSGIERVQEAEQQIAIRYEDRAERPRDTGLPVPADAIFRGQIC